jgi:hypothetical protein
VAGSDRRQVRSVLDRAIEFIEDLHLAEVLAADVEIVDLPVHEGAPLPEHEDAEG